MRPRLSIVMPLFNKAAYVADALNAFIPQLEIGDEVIVVDDCSTDDSVTVVKEVLDGALNTRLICMEKNAGPASARNAGARVASGSHLLFFDADDLPAPNLLNSVKEAIYRYPEDTIFTYGIAFQAHGETWSDSISKAPCAHHKRDRHAFVLDSLRGRTLCTASSTCIEKTVFLAAGGFQEYLRYCEDPELWARLSANHEVVVIEDILALYRDIPNSLSYQWRGRIGSVNPYVNSLLKLAHVHGELYRSLAQSIIFKNLVYARAAGASHREAANQLQLYRGFLTRARTIVLLGINSFPSVLLDRLIKYGLRFRKQRTSRVFKGVFQ